MCDPVTGVISLASVAGWSAVAGTAVSLAAQSNNADMQDASNEAQHKNSLNARNQNAAEVEQRRVQEAEAAGERIGMNNIAMREAQAAVVARAGPSGLSVDALLANLAMKGANYNDSVNQNLDRTNKALDNQLTNVNNRASSEINSLKSPTTPDYLGAALQITSAAGSYDKTPGAWGRKATNG